MEYIWYIIASLGAGIGTGLAGLSAATTTTYARHKNIVNYNHPMTKFVHKVYMSGEKIGIAPRMTSAFYL